ncbi:MAG: alpha/beta hydrolase [Alistipes sp.]|nr:alpha/beta hydrolase [Alistipes sp.]
MRRAIFSLLLATFAITTASAQKTVDVPNNADKVVKIWDNSTAPHSNEESKDESLDKNNFFRNTSETVLYIYKADKQKNRGRCVVVLAGGGYGAVCIGQEGFPFAEWLKEEGITCIAVKYRLPNYGHKEVPLEDAQAALRYAREHAKELDIDPTKVGIMGCSAGGHLAAYTSTFTPDEQKPNFSILFYPVITGTTWQTHMGTFNRLLGKERTPEMTERYSLENQVTSTTPPTILLLSDDDLVVPPISSIRYYEELKNHGVKASMYIFPSGGHGWVGRKDFKYEQEYKHLLLDWLSTLN